MTENAAKQAILTVARELGLTMAAEFVPFSQSRNKDKKPPSLNWRVTIARTIGARTKDLLATDYSAGCAHAPSYKQGGRTVMQEKVVAWECEHGVRGRWVDNASVYQDIRPFTHGMPPNRAKLQPDFADVLYSLANDYDVLDHATYESWAEEYGFDPDSRTGEAVYRACMEIALRLRNGVGEVGMIRLREACQDY